MTDPIETPVVTPGRGIKIALAVSVALNLAVAGLVGGMVLHGGPGQRGDMMVREMGFGPFDEALLPQDRENLRSAVAERFGEVRHARKQMQADALAILSALEAAPFDPAALTAALDGQADHMSERLKFGSGVVRDYLLTLSDEARAAFADRLQQRMRHGRDEGEKAGD